MSLPDDPVLSARIIAKTAEYLDTPSVTGAEAPFLDHLARDFMRLKRDAARSDGLCVIAGKRDDAPIVVAHVDRHGGVVTPDGAIAPTPKDPESEPVADDLTARATAHAQRLVGEQVYAYDRDTGARLAYADIESLDDGPRFTCATLAGVPAGSPVALSRSIDRTQSGYFSGWLDNAVAVATAYIVAASGADAHFVFVGGKRSGDAAARLCDWAAAKGVSGARFVSLSTSAFDDSAASQAGAVVLRRRDADASFADSAVRRLEQAAEAASAPIIFKDAFIEAENAARARRGEAARPLGSTLAGRLTAQTRGQCAGASLQIPVFNRNTSCETTTPRAMTALARTLFRLCTPTS